ncbi:MAG: putative flavoprotein (TIGR03862 family) [Bermanella sp.]|jgi:uncharacterized flavoprotein (TIGR03862 family)
MHAETTNQSYPAIVVGGGPAGLMAAEQLADAGIAVAVFDAMPTLGRKFLRAGIGGLNLTHSEASEQFPLRYADRQTEISNLLSTFDANALRAWSETLGIKTFVGSSGRVFPKEMKAAPLLRKWLSRLRSKGVTFNTRHRWCGWEADGSHCFDTPSGKVQINADAAVFALGGASWSALGTDGRWAEPFAERGLQCIPFKPSNGGFLYDWREDFKRDYAGAPIKNIGLSIVLDNHSLWQQKGEMMISDYGLEGSLIYAASRHIRDAIDNRGSAKICLDFQPGRSKAELYDLLQKRKDSAANHLRKLGIKDAKLALFKTLTSKEQMQDIKKLPALLKALPQTLTGYSPIDQAISTAGGLSFSELNDKLMLTQKPGIFCAGEMLDWEAPTGGYLLTACFAGGVVAGRGAVEFLRTQSAPSSA